MDMNGSDARPLLPTKINSPVVLLTQVHSGIHIPHMQYKYHGP